MKTKHLSILLAVLLTAGVALSAALLIIGPNKVERQTVELFRTQQSLIAEQGAMRISETIRDIQTRLDEAAEQIERYGPAPGETGRLQQTLDRLGHPNDERLGLGLLMTSEDGDVTAVGRAMADERARHIADRQLTLAADASSSSVHVCAYCLDLPGTITIVATLEDGRRLAANIRLENLLDGIFDRITRGRHAVAALHDAQGEVLFDNRISDRGGSGELIAGTAPVNYAGWHVHVETPRAAVAPEVRETVRSVLYASIGMIVVLALALGVLGYLKFREQSERLERVQALARTDKLATVGMLGSSIAHEIRNIISAVKMNLELARRNGDGENHESIDKASDSIGRLEELTENITGYVGAQRGEDEPFDLQAAVEEAINLVNPKLDPSMLAVEANAHPVVDGSKGAIVQVIVNLLLNAYDATVDESDATITVRVETDGERGLVEVIDTGPGIDPAILDHIFEPFTSTKGADDEGGTGLGLWLSSEIIDQHGGTIRAENREAGGARFVVALPVVRSVTSTGEEASRDAASRTDPSPSQPQPSI